MLHYACNYTSRGVYLASRQIHRFIFGTLSHWIWPEENLMVPAVFDRRR